MDCLGLQSFMKTILTVWALSLKLLMGWNAQATWYVARSILGTLGFELRNPYPLHRQKAFIVPGIVPENRIEILKNIPTWDEWDPDRDRWQYEVDV